MARRARHQDADGGVGMARGSNSYTAKRIRRAVGDHVPPDLDARADKAARPYLVLATDVRTGMSMTRLCHAHSPFHAVDLAAAMLREALSELPVVMEFTNVSAERYRGVEPLNVPPETPEQAAARRERWRREQGL